MSVVMDIYGLIRDLMTEAEKVKADAKAQNFRMCLSEYLLQSGQIHKNDESEKQEWIFQRQPAE